MSRWDNDRDTRHYAEDTADWGLRFILVRAAIVVAVVAVVVVGVWAVKVAIAPTQGQGDAIRSREAAPNRIAAQELFEHRYQEILAADRNLTGARTALDANPDNPNRQTEYIGLAQYCERLVGEYNAQARSYTQEQFRAADLPAQIDHNDPTTDCKE
jgi:hypothetical protein